MLRARVEGSETAVKEKEELGDGSCCCCPP